MDRSVIPLGEQFVKEIGLFNEVSDDSLYQLCDKDLSPKNGLNKHETVKDVIVSLNLNSLQRTGSNQLCQSGLLPSSER